ncbi:MAG: heme-binding protein [Thermoleophilia bacterium]|nr:heme-binding protein [Thermoleophilia bacterium]
MKVSLEAARDLIARGHAKAAGFDKAVTIAIVDEGGYLVAIERMDGARPLAPSIATAKAYTAAIMQRPTTMLKGLSEDEPMFFSQIGRMGQHEIVAVEGGIPIRKDGEILGGIGVSGATAEEDHQICESVLSDAGYDADFAG